MADPTLPDPLAAPAPVDPNAPPLVGGFLGALLPAQAPVADQGLAPGIGVPNATLDGAVAAGPPPPLGPDGQPLPLGAGGAPALPDVGDQIGLAPDGSGPGTAPAGGASPTFASTLSPFLSPFASVPGALSNLIPSPDAPTLPDGDVIKDDARGREPGAPLLDDLVEPTTPGGILNQNRGYSQEQQEDYLKRLAIQDPAEFAAVAARHERARQIDADTALLKASQENNDRTRADLQMRQEAVAKAQASMARIVQDSKAMAATKIDPSHYMNSRSGGQVLLDLIGAISGGLAAGAVPGGNGVNHYLEVMKGRVDNDIDAQAKNIANGWKGIEMEKSAVGEAYARSGDLYQATETARLATWEAIKGQIATQAQLYDPKGTLALSAANAYQQAAAQSDAAAYKVGQDLEKNNIERGKAGLEQIKTRAAIDQKQQELVQTDWHNRAGIGVDYSRIKAEADNQARQDKLERDKMAQAAELAAAKAKEEAQKGTDTVGGFTQNDDGTTTVGAMKMKNGDEWRVKDAQAPEIKEVTGAVINSNRLGNHLIALMNQMGKADKVTRTGLAQEAQQTAHDYILQMHAAAHIKSFKPTSLEYVEGLAGAPHPDAFITQGQSGIRSALSNLKENYATYLAINGYDGKPPTLPDTSRPPAHSQTLDEQRDEAIQNAPDAKVGALDNVISATGGPVGKALFGPSGVPDLTGFQDPQVANDTVAAAAGGISTEARTAIDAWTKDLDSKDPKIVSNAVAHLGNATEKAANDATKAAAAKAISDHGLQIARDAAGVFRDRTPKAD